MLDCQYLLTRESSKILKSHKMGVATGILYLSPHTEAGIPGVNTCPASTAECRRYCLRTSGRMRFHQSTLARAARTRFYAHHFADFQTLLFREINNLILWACKQDKVPMVRLNGTSDIPWEVKLPAVFEEFPHIQFYDYTKIRGRMERFLAGQMPHNYHLTFSRSEGNLADCQAVLDCGGNVAVIFPGKQSAGAWPEFWEGYPVIDGDESDVRPWDPSPCVVGLSAKGELVKAESESAFVATESVEILS